MASSHLRRNLTVVTVGDDAMTSLALWRHVSDHALFASLTEQLSRACELAITFSESVDTDSVIPIIGQTAVYMSHRRLYVLRF